MTDQVTSAADLAAGEPTPLWLEAHAACNGDRDAMWDWLAARLEAAEAALTEAKMWIADYTECDCDEDSTCLIHRVAALSPVPAVPASQQLSESERTQIRERGGRACNWAKGDTERQVGRDVLALDAALTEAEAWATEGDALNASLKERVSEYLARAEAAEKERDAIRESLQQYDRGWKAAEKERDEARRDADHFKASYRRSMLVDPAFCCVGSESGPNREMLLCGFEYGHEGQHSWAALPTFPIAVADAEDQRSE